MKESEMQRRFGRQNSIPGVFELKISHNGVSIQFEALEPHQKQALINAYGDTGVGHKISDFSYGKKPFDCFMMKNYPAYVVVGFHQKRMRHITAYYLMIPRWMAMEKMLSPRKSAKEAEIAEYANHMIKLVP